jgi:hypothetical protein
VEEEVAMTDSHGLLLDRISLRLHELFDGHITLADVLTKPSQDQEAALLTRSLAALALVDEADLTPDQAAKCVTDGGADGGIDALYVNDKKKIVYFVQSKWRSGKGGVQLVDFTRFRDGVKDLISLNWSPDNANLHLFRPQIEKALKDIDTSVAMLLVHSSEFTIAKNIQKKITDFLSEQNKYVSDFLEFKEIDLTRVAHIARSKTRASDIDLSILLRHWGIHTKPYEAVYGSISAVDVARWHDAFGHKLFAENLRYVIEKSDVNEGIIPTRRKDDSGLAAAL